MYVFIDRESGWARIKEDAEYTYFASVGATDVVLRIPNAKVPKFIGEMALEVSENFSRILKDRRKELDMSQGELATAWGVTQPEVHSRETDNVHSLSVHKYLQLCNVLRVGIGYFLTGRKKVSLVDKASE